MCVHVCDWRENSTDHSEAKVRCSWLCWGWRKVCAKMEHRPWVEQRSGVCACVYVCVMDICIRHARSPLGRERYLPAKKAGCLTLLMSWAFDNMPDRTRNTYIGFSLEEIYKFIPLWLF